MLKGMEEVLGPQHKEAVIHSYKNSLKFREAALAYLERKENETLTKLKKDDNLTNDKSDFRLTLIAELKAIDKLKNILE